jgi:hypothetical protein
MDSLEIIKSGNFKDIESLFATSKTDISNKQTESIEQFNIEDHDVFDPLERKNKEIKKDTGQKDGTGKPITEHTTVPVTRIGMPYQELIVERRIGFVLGNTINLDPIYSLDSENNPEKKVFEFVKRIWADCKLDYKNKSIARKSWSELEAAELWYWVEAESGGFWDKVSISLGIKKAKFSMKMKILSPSLGDKLYPLFDISGDMVAFARKYVMKENNIEIEHFDVYTNEIIYKYAKRGDWAIDADSPGGGVIQNPIGKIPVIYYPEDNVEWFKVQSMIERQETIVSNHGDMNDYFGSPILAVVGEILGYAEKGQQGKVLQLAKEAKANYLALESPPESIKMEIDNLEKFIFAFSQTPNISFAEMKGLVGNLPVIGIKALFMDAHMAALNKVETYGLGIQRRLNFLKAAVGNLLDVSLMEPSKSLQIIPEFTPYMPTNAKEEIETIGSAVMSEVMSKVTATEKLEKMGYITDAIIEQQRLKEEADAAISTGANAFGG